MTEIDLNFIAEQLKRVLTEQAAQRATLTDIADDQTVLAQMVLRIERDMVRVKDLLGKLDSRLAHLETAP